MGLINKRNLLEDICFWQHYAKTDGSLDWYKSLFSKAASNGKITGDITPAYSTLTEASIKRLRSLNPNLKLIFILRNPIDRSYSQAARNLNADKALVAKKGTSVSQNLNQQIIDFLHSEDCLSRSDYLGTLARYEKFFSPEDIFIDFFDEIKANPHKLLTNICDFIGVKPVSQDHVMKESPNPRSHLLGKIHPEILDSLIELHSDNLEKMSSRFGSYATEWHQQLLDYRSKKAIN
ncbi:MAG: sulfotransferase domain-containing protein [Cyanobacteria bacterium P01_A01_bin.83]